MSTPLPMLNESDIQLLSSRVTDEEIYNAMFGMKRDSCGGPDGFNAVYFTHCWDVIANDLKNAMHNFFEHNKLPTSINATNLCLVPKGEHVTTLHAYRPIACCNIIYKCISKVIAARLRHVLPTVISDNQAAFLNNRSILDNVLATHELLNGYGRTHVSPRAMMKLDIKRAYDTVSLEALTGIMGLMGFPGHFVSWIHTCISTVSYSLCYNGGTVGYFRSQRGIRQGDPMSSYLFIIVMEFFTQLVNKQVVNNNYELHPKCRNPLITSLLFADDVLLFVKPTVSTMDCVKSILHTFEKCTGLQVNRSKSFLLVAGLNDSDNQHIHHESQLPNLPEGTVHLGIPLCSRRIGVTACLPLFERITEAMNRWASNKLSQAGRTTIIKSIIQAMTVYWCRCFILPSALLTTIRKAMNHFLWTGSMYSKKLIPIAFAKLEKSQKYGGLGIKCMRTWNQAAFSKHFDNLINEKPNLWVKWARQHHLGNKNL